MGADLSQVKTSKAEMVRVPLGGIHIILFLTFDFGLGGGSFRHYLGELLFKEKKTLPLFPFPFSPTGFVFLQQVRKVRKDQQEAQSAKAPPPPPPSDQKGRRKVDVRAFDPGRTTAAGRGRGGAEEGEGL